jgi:uncharacterized repeat protein (TIGR01451 family)
LHKGGKSVSRKTHVFVSVLIVLAFGLGLGSSAQTPTTYVPLGLMGPSGDSPPELGTEQQKMYDIAAEGFNIVYEFRGVQEIAEAREYLNRARRAGLQVVQNMPLCRAYRADDAVCQQYPVSIWSEAQWARFIGALVPYDNLVAWYLPDEIDDYEVAARLFGYVREYDPRDRPVYANPGSFEQSDIDQFPAFSDFLWGVSYPELFDEPRVLTTHMMRMNANACQGTDTEWGAILQFFESTQFPQYGTTGHPSARELRSDSYQSIIGGAKGLWYFNYEMGLEDELNDLWNEMVTIRDEILGSGQLDQVILEPDVPQGVAKHIVSGPTQSPTTYGQVYDSIQYLQKWRDGVGTYLFAVNVATDTVQVEFRNLWAEADTVEVLFEDRSIPIVDDAFADTFAQDDVHIYFYAAPVPADPRADTSIAIVDLPDPVDAGTALTYNLVYGNDGPSDAENITITDTLPAEVDFGGMVSVPPGMTGPVQVGSSLIWSKPLLAAGISETIVFTVTANTAATGVITNQAVIASDTIDENPTDNTASEQTSVFARSYLPIICAGWNGVD